MTLPDVDSNWTMFSYYNYLNAPSRRRDDSGSDHLESGPSYSDDAQTLAPDPLIPLNALQKDSINEIRCVYLSQYLFQSASQTPFSPLLPIPRTQVQGMLTEEIMNHLLTFQPVTKATLDYIVAQLKNRQAKFVLFLGFGGFWLFCFLYLVFPNDT